MYQVDRYRRSRKLALTVMVVVSASLARQATTFGLRASSAAATVDLVAVTEDRVIPEDGCDAISIFQVSTGRVVSRGRRVVSPGRLTGTVDFQLLLATTSNGSYARSGDYRDGWEPFVYGLRQLPTERWSTRVLIGDEFSSLSAPAVTRDGRSLLLGTSGQMRFIDFLSFYPRAPFYLTKRLLPALSTNPERIDRTTSRIRLPGVPFLVHPTSDGHTALVATDRATVHTIDIDTMTETGPTVSVSPVAGAHNQFYGTTIQSAHGTVTADERFVITNQNTVPAVSVVDLLTRQTWNLPLTGLDHVGGVTINRGWVNAGLLAAHGGEAIAVYRFSPPAAPVLVGRLQVSNPKCWTGWVTRETFGPFCSIAWSTDGRYLIAATDEGTAEFVVIDVLDGGATLQPRHYLVACRDPENLPNDIFTLNGLITPTATPTSAVTTTPVPSATATGTPSPTPTATAVVSATPSPTASATASPTATATRIPVPAYIPLALAESCTPSQRHVDVALVVDASSSMLGPTTTGRSKLAAAVAAARAFLDQLQLAAGDQATLVTFNSEATLLAPLTADRAALDAALSAVATARETRLDRGVAVAREELASDRQRPDNTPVMIVLTDGRANPVPAEVAVDEARRAKDAGVQVFTIGLGADLDEAALRQMASRPEWFYVAPDAEDLAAVYRTIAVAIPCPPAAFWGRR